MTQTSTTDTDEGGRRHVPALDGIRGVAIAAVMLTHFVAFRPQSRLDVAVLTVCRVGWVGVDLFFVLSGFLITGILFSSKGKPHYFRDFYARRSLRIFPLYYGVLAAIAFVRWCAHLPPFPHSTWLWLYGTNLCNTITSGASFVTPLLILDHFWSLAVEEHFYLVWPWLVLLLSRRACMIACVACIVIAPFLRLGFWALHHSPRAPYVFTLCRVDSLAFGCLLSICLGSASFRAAAARRRRHVLVGIGTCAATMVILFSLARSTGWHPGPVQVIGYSVLDLLFALTILLLQTSPGGRMQRVLVARPLRTLGKYSYGLYVYHGMLLALLWRVIPFEAVQARTGSGLIAVLLQAACGIAVSFAAAWVSYNAVEKQFLKLKRFFGPPAAAAVPALSRVDAESLAVN